jgi:hypothetical protein
LTDKEFDDEVFSGTCVSIDEKRGLYHIEYEDDDEEDLDLGEVTKLLKGGKAAQKKWAGLEEHSQKKR